MRHSNTSHSRAALFMVASLMMLGLCSAPTLAQQPATDSATILRSVKTIFVKSSSLLVGRAVVEDKLRKRSEFKQLGLAITRNVEEADLILELRHDVFTMYVYTAIDPRTDVVVASGKLSSLGGTVAGKVAKRFMKEMVRARGGS